MTRRRPARNAPRPDRARRRALAGSAGLVAVVVALLGVLGTATAPPAEALTVRRVAVDPSSKASVLKAYRDVLLKAEKVPSSWSGAVKGCAVGKEGTASLQATLDAVNYYRAMVQLDPVNLNSTWNTQALRSSLVTAANKKLSHSPSSSSRCWSSSAATAAGTSNLYLATPSSTTSSSAKVRMPSTGARAVSGYMDDKGTTNTAVGHRRWILNPTTREMGSGSTHVSNTLKVFGVKTSTKAAKPRWMEWPPAGWSPTQIEPAGRWSLSASSSKVSFAKAKVKVVGSSGKALKVKRYAPKDGYGPDTLVWDVSLPALPKGSATAAYKVTVSGITGTTHTTYSYAVRLFDASAVS